MSQEKEKKSYPKGVEGEEIDGDHYKCGRCGLILSKFTLGYKLISVGLKLQVMHPICSRCSNETVPWESWSKKSNEGIKEEA